MDWRSFYDPDRWTRGFGAWAKDYTIALAPFGGGYHIGLDFGTGRRAVDVPALVSGVVVRVINTIQLGAVVVLDCGGRGFFSYCHLSKDRLPDRGDWVGQGERVGRLAAGPNQGKGAVSFGNVEYPGTAWDGIHLHLVIGRHPESAYSKVPGNRTLDSFTNPAVVIRELLAAPAGSGAKTFDSEEEDMTPEQARMLEDIHKAVAVPRPNADYSLVRLADRPEVFLSTNRETVRWIKNERELELVRYTLRGVGAPAADRDVEVIGDLPAYGTIIGERPPGYEGL